METVPVILRKQGEKETLRNGVGVVDIAVFVISIIGSIIGNKT